jgi:hypothetical protein
MFTWQGQTAHTRRQTAPSSVNGQSAVPKFPPLFAEHKRSLPCLLESANGPYPLSWTDRLIGFSKTFSSWQLRHVFPIHQYFRDRLRLHQQGFDLYSALPNCMPVQHRNLHLAPSKYRIIPTLGRSIFLYKRHRKVEISLHVRPYSIS